MVASGSEAVFDAAVMQAGAGSPGRMALHVDGNGIHGDVGGRQFNVYGESGGIATEALWTHPELVHGFGQFPFEFGPQWIGTHAAQRPSGRLLGQMHTDIRRAAQAYAHYGGRTGL